MDDRDGDGPESEAYKEQAWLGNVAGPNLFDAERGPFALVQGTRGLGGASVAGAGLHGELAPTPSRSARPRPGSRTTSPSTRPPRRPATTR